jgi:hypothetical protein
MAQLCPNCAQTLRQVTFQLGGSVTKIPLIHDVVPVENRSCLMFGYCSCDLIRDSGVVQIRKVLPKEMIIAFLLVVLE